MKDKPYLCAIGKLTWLANGTQLDTTHAAGVLARFNNCVGKAQWTAVKHLLHNIKGTMDYKLQYGSPSSSYCLCRFLSGLLPVHLGGLRVQDRTTPGTGHG
jgi:hypothetical protein